MHEKRFTATDIPDDIQNHFFRPGKSNQEIGLHKLSRAFDLKRVVHVLELCEQL